MLPNCSHLLTDFRTVFVFALGSFLPMFVIFFGFYGNFNGKMAKNRHKWSKMVKNGQNGHLWPSGPRAKTKTVLKSVSKWEQFVSMQNFKLCPTRITLASCDDRYADFPNIF